MAYQGPNVQVTQNFVTTPPAVAVESLPPAGIGTAYDVYSKEFLSEAYGIVSREALWGATDVVWDDSVLGNRLYDFYPVKVYAQSAFGNMKLSPTKSATGATIVKDEMYTIPNTEKAVGFCEAFLPFYNKTLGAATVKILATDLTTVIATGAALATSKIQAGETVFIKTGGTFVEVGTVAGVGSDETKIKLAAAYSAPITDGTDIVVGAFDITHLDRPNCIYDQTADFVAAKIKVGDIVKITSLSLASEIVATITAIVNKNMLKFNTVTPTTGREDWDFYSYKTSTATPASTISVSTYKVDRLVGFSQNYGYKALNAGAGVAAVKVSATNFKVLLTNLAPLLTKGDYIAMTTTNAATPASYYKIDTALVDATHQIYTTTEIIKNEGAVEYSNGNFVHAWQPMRTHNILADFRAIRSEEQQVVKRITSQQDIVTAWCKDDEISPYNELAYAMSISLASAGGQVCYGVNVDAASTNLAAEYSEALESLKMYDVYSHFLCTTNGGVNALMAPYCDEQSAPYEAHERIAVVGYDQEDVFLQGVDTGTTTSGGVITISGAINLVTAGVTVGDIVRIYNSTGDLQATVNVIATPEAGTPSVCRTDGDSAYAAATMTFKFLSNRKEDQAIRIGNLGAGNRRLTVVWPGWFEADVGTTTITLPPYYITASICGADCINSPSQSFTNREFSIPGISNIKLNTSSYFRKSQLDEIGGGGIDIMIQDGNISQVIKSRHDLTTNMDAVEYRERSITKQADVAAKTIRSATAPYIGKYNITQKLLDFLGQISATVATKLIKNGIIANMQIVSIERDANIADKININITVTVFVAGNYYDIQMLIVSR